LIELLRRRRRAKQGILPKRLKGEAAQKRGDTVPFKGEIIPGTIVDIHGHNEDNNVNRHKKRHEPRGPVNFWIVNIVSRSGGVGGGVLGGSSTL